MPYQSVKMLTFKVFFISRIYISPQIFRFRRVKQLQRTQKILDLNEEKMRTISQELHEEKEVQ